MRSKTSVPRSGAVEVLGRMSECQHANQLIAYFPATPPLRQGPPRRHQLGLAFCWANNSAPAPIHAGFPGGSTLCESGPETAAPQGNLPSCMTRFTTNNKFLALGHRSLGPSRCRKPPRHTPGHSPFLHCVRHAWFGQTKHQAPLSSLTRLSIRVYAVDRTTAGQPPPAQ